MAKTVLSLAKVRLIPVKSSLKYQGVAIDQKIIGIWAVSPVDGLEGTEFKTDVAEQIINTYPDQVTVVPVIIDGSYQDPIAYRKKIIAEREAASKETTSQKSESSLDKKSS